MAAPLSNGGNGASKTKLMADINITPMVDVMLVLLVIFMVTAPLLVAGVRVDLPKNTAAKISHLQKPIVLTFGADGSLYIGDDQIERSTLGQRLKDLKAKDPEGTVYLRADRKLAYGDILELMGLVQNAGFQKISLLSQATNAGGSKTEDAIKTPGTTPGKTPGNNP